MEIKKINDNSWEIPKTGGMRVPAVVFASEKLMQNIKRDKTLEQVRNVAHLKGIQKASYAMPDAHQGYGFSIGGVAAFDLDEGIVSPGGVGYDINCLTGEAKILTDDGHYQRIKDFDTKFIELQNADSYTLKAQQKPVVLASFNFDRSSFSCRQAHYFMKKKHTGRIYTIATKLGFKIKVTGEHPILTKSGMVSANLLKKDAAVAVHPFEGVEFSEATDKTILVEQDFSREQRRELILRNLLPLKYNHTYMTKIAKLFGYMLGDGNIHYYQKKGRICAFGDKEDLRKIQKDFKLLGFSARIYSRIRDHKINTQYGEVEFKSKNSELHVSSSSLASLFVALGYPLGKKTVTEYLVPDWIISSPLHIKRAFLSGLFGAELSSPRTHTKTGFDCPVFSQNKNEGLLDNGREFCIQLMTMLAEFGIETDKITDRKEHFNKQGKTVRIRLQISSRESNLLKLWSNIGFSYNKKRDFLSQISILYLNKKKEMTKIRSKIAQKTKDLKIKGLSVKEVQRILATEYANNRFIERHYYEKAGQRIPLDFISFSEYVKKLKIEHSKYGLFFDKIKSIRTEEFNGEVYDFNVDETHNFIANGIVVSNCGVRLLKTNFTEKDVLDKRKELLNGFFAEVPAGVGKGGKTRVTRDILSEVLVNGSEWAVKNGYGIKDDLQRTEEYGKMPKADPNAVSDRAFKRGMPQLGTLGAGNHFLEIQKVDKIYDKEIAEKFGVSEGQINVMIHCGSRGLGHQVASDYIRSMENKYGFADLPDRELINAPINSDLGQDYLNAMAGAINFAFVNRQMIAHWTRGVFEKVMGTSDGMDQVYDVCHNLAKIEMHDGKKLCIHRKGATRSFGPGREEIPEVYRSVGQPVLIPGSMGTASYVLVGTKKAEELTFGSTAHGAGRVMSRHEAIRTFRGEQVRDDLAKKGIMIKGASMKGIAEETYQAYKDVDEVVRVSHETGIGKLVYRVVPVAVMKG